MQYVFSLLPRHWHWHMRALRRQGHCHETRVQEGVAKRTAYPRVQGAATPWLQSQRVSRKPSANALLSSQRKRRHRLTRACAYADEPQANVFYEEARSSAIIHTCAPAPAPARVAFARLSACVRRHRIRSSSLGGAASFATRVLTAVSAATGWRAWARWILRAHRGQGSCGGTDRAVSGGG